VNGGPGGPPHDPAREQIDHDGQVEPALPGPDVGDVRDPRRVWVRRGELPLQKVRNQDRRLPTAQRRVR